MTRTYYPYNCTRTHILYTNTKFNSGIQIIILIESKKHTVTAYTIISRNDNTYYLDVNIQDF